MILLVDTHAFIWWENEPKRLSPKADAAFTDTSNTLLISIASIWEIQIKMQLGKLSLKGTLSSVVKRQMQMNRFKILRVSPKHVYVLAQLPDHHRDPFDRMLVAQAMHENIPIMTSDASIVRYPVQVVW